jgi:GNAT superfamily N-acetyltransferase
VLSARRPGHEAVLYDGSVRVALESDLPAVMMLVRDCIEDMKLRGIEQWDEIYPAHANFSADVTEGSLYAAFSTGEDLVGVFALNGFQDPEYTEVPWSFLDASVGVVHRLMVNPRFQGQGVARALMVTAERLAVELGFAVLRLDAFSSNPQALRLYRSVGYREAGNVVFRKGRFHCFEKRLRSQD